MTTRGPPAALPMRPLPSPIITPASATLPASRPRPATATLSHHPRSHTPNPVPPSKIARVRSWIGRTKIYLAAAIGLLTLIVTIVSLLPSFAGGRYGKKALELALWTARKDYVEACQTYLDRTNSDCEHALEKGLPPPPGRDGIPNNVGSPIGVEIQPETHTTDFHVVLRCLWVVIGMIVLALILNRQLKRFTYLVRRQLGCLNRVDDSELHQQHSATLRAQIPSQATSTGISADKSGEFVLREIPPRAKLEI